MAIPPKTPGVFGFSAPSGRHVVNDVATRCAAQRDCVAERVRSPVSGDLLGVSSHTPRELSTPFGAARHPQPGSASAIDDNDAHLRQSASGAGLRFHDRRPRKRRRRRSGRRVVRRPSGLAVHDDNRADDSTTDGALRRHTYIAVALHNGTMTTGRWGEHGAGTTAPTSTFGTTGSKKAASRPPCSLVWSVRPQWWAAGAFWPPAGALSPAGTWPPS